MLRLIYICLLRCHPRGFKQRFADEMLWIYDQKTARERAGTVGARLIVDGVVSLMRQWVLRPELRRGPAVARGEALAEISPMFYSIESFRPRPAALLHGAALSLAVFCSVFFAMRYSWTHRVHLLLPVLAYESGWSAPESTRALIASVAGRAELTVAGEQLPPLERTANPSTRPDTSGETTSLTARPADQAARQSRPQAATAETRHQVANETSAAVAFHVSAKPIVPPAPERPNFSGKWKLNVANSDFAGQLAPTSAVLQIDDRAASLKIVRTIVRNNGHLTTETLYFTGCQETTNTVPGGNQMRTTANWDGSVLLLETKANSTSDFTIKWKWTMSQDGRTITAVRELPRAEGAQIEVYEKTEN